jgi:hypothetical protein
MITEPFQRCRGGGKQRSGKQQRRAAAKTANNPHFQRLRGIPQADQGLHGSSPDFLRDFVQLIGFPRFSSGFPARLREFSPRIIGAQQRRAAATMKENPVTPSHFGPLRPLRSRALGSRVLGPEPGAADWLVP